MSEPQWNIILRSCDGQRALAIGKLVRPRLGQHVVYHYWASPDEMRTSHDAWGMREAVLAHCLDHGVSVFYIYDKRGNVTYVFTYADLLRNGIRGKADEFGATINVPRAACGTVPGKVEVPYVKDGVVRVIRPEHEYVFDVFEPT